MMFKAQPIQEPCTEVTDPTDKSTNTVQSGSSKTLRSRLLSGAFWSTAGRVCSVGALFATEVCMGRTLSESDCAAYFAASAFVVLLATGVLFGTPQIIIRAIKDSLKNGRVDAVRGIARNSFTAIAMTSVVAYALAFLGGFVVGDEPKWRAVSDFSLLVGTWACCSAACQIGAGILQSLDDFRSAILVGARQGGVVANSLFLIFALLAYQSGMLSLGFVLMLQAVLNAAALLVAWWSIESALKKHEQSIISESGPTASVDLPLSEYSVRRILQESWPNFVFQLTSQNIVYIQVLVLGWLASERSVTDYYSALRLLSLVQVAQLLAAAILGPFIAELVAHNRIRQLERILRGAATLIAIPTLLATLILVLFPETVIHFTFGDDFLGAASPMQILAVGTAISVITGCNGMAMVMSGNQMQLMKISLLAFGILLLVIIPSIEHWDALGAAWTATIIYGIYNLYVTYLVKRNLGIWTFPSLSPQDLRDTISSLSRRRNKIEP